MIAEQLKTLAPLRSGGRTPYDRALLDEVEATSSRAPTSPLRLVAVMLTFWASKIA